MTLLQKSRVLILALLILPCIIYTQTIISGTIRDEISDIPIIGASVIIQNTNEGSVSDANGNFSFRTNLDLPLTVTVSFVGYSPRNVLYQTDQNQVIHLKEGLAMGDEIIITASRKSEKASEAPASISIVGERILKSQTLMSPAMSLRNLQGIEVTQQGIDHFQINLRGRTDAFTTDTYFIKDYRNLMVPGQGIIALGRTSLNDLDIDRIEVVRGPGSALYGPGVETGVVHFITKSPLDHPGTSVSLGTGTKSNFSIAGRHAGSFGDKLGFKIVGHFNRADDFILDPEDPIDAESLAAFQPQVISGLTGEVIKTSNELETKVSNYSLLGELEFKPHDDLNIRANAGYNYRKGLVRADLGEALQDYPYYFAQVRLDAKNLFAQVYLNGTNQESDENILYRTGITSFSNNKAYQAQVQYDWPVIENKFDLTLGSEIQLIRAETKGTVHGRFENSDDFNIYSLYAQAKYSISSNLYIVGALRVDDFSAINETTISPRAGLGYQPFPTHNFRFTYNRAITSPSSLFIFADIPFGVSPAFDIPFLGGIQPISYADPVVTTSLIPGVGEYPGTDMPLAIPYAIALGGISNIFSQEVVDYLGSKLSQISGTTSGIPILNGQPVSTFPERGSLRSTKTSAYELGYKGVLGGKLAVGLDIYYNQRKDLIFAGPVSLLVINPTLTADLISELNRVIDPSELAVLGVSQQEIVQAYTNIANGLAANPLGLIEPEVEYPSSNPQFIITPSNTGEVNYFGAEISFQYYFNDLFSTFANYSWLNENFFSDEEIDLAGTGQVYSLNTPKNRIRFGIDHIPNEKGATFSASVRYQDKMEVSNGTIFVGTVDSYTIIDLSLGFNFGNGFSLNATAQNLFDKKYRVMPRMPKIGRLVLIKGVYEF